jgi:hypothetical protein
MAAEQSWPHTLAQDAHFETATSTHTMGTSLLRYVQPKIHQDIRNHKWSKILVRGHYTRKPPATPADNEKKDKPFNWHRPTAEILDKDTIALNCFPGMDYVQHYAGLVATYLAANGKDPSVVQCLLPTKAECMEPFTQSNLREMGNVDVVVLGYTAHLTRFVKGKWDGRETEDSIFGWQKHVLSNGQIVAFLGCMPSFWGDISGHLILALQMLNNVKCVIYVGKAGSLNDDDRPNEIIGTGNRSYIGPRIVQWTNVLAKSSTISSKILEGDHVTVNSPLCESLEWLQHWEQKCRWVDCEVGHMADVSNTGGTAYGYLHVVSDNIAKPYPYNLSNEHLEAVISRREILFRELEVVLQLFFDQWSSENL